MEDTAVDALNGISTSLISFSHFVGMSNVACKVLDVTKPINITL
jgi:hypothetical protein